MFGNICGSGKEPPGLIFFFYPFYDIGDLLKRNFFVDVFLINKDGPGWLDGLKFEGYLKNHPADLEKYRMMKENGKGIISFA